MGLQGHHSVHHPLHRDRLTRAPFSTPSIAQRWAYKGTIQYTIHCTEMGLQGHHSVHHPLHRDGLTRAPLSTPPIAQRWAYKGTIQYTTHCTEMGLQGHHSVHHPLHRDGITKAPFTNACTTWLNMQNQRFCVQFMYMYSACGACLVH